MILLSGTMMDKAEHAPSFERIMGYIDSRELMRQNETQGGVKLEGLQQLIDRASIFNRAGVEEVVRRIPINKNTKNQFALAILTDVLRDATW